MQWLLNNQREAIFKLFYKVIESFFSAFSINIIVHPTYSSIASSNTSGHTDDRCHFFAVTRELIFYHLHVYFDTFYLIASASAHTARISETSYKPDTPRSPRHTPTPPFASDRPHVTLFFFSFFPLYFLLAFILFFVILLASASRTSPRVIHYFFASLRHHQQVITGKFATFNITLPWVVMSL